MLSEVRLVAPTSVLSTAAACAPNRWCSTFDLRQIERSLIYLVLLGACLQLADFLVTFWYRKWLWMKLRRLFSDHMLDCEQDIMQYADPLQAIDSVLVSVSVTFLRCCEGHEKARLFYH